MSANQYQCANCHGVFKLVRDETWSDEKARQELKDNFGNVSVQECDRVCDDCYQKFMTWFVQLQ